MERPESRNHERLGLYRSSVSSSSTGGGTGGEVCLLRLHLVKYLQGRIVLTVVQVLAADVHSDSGPVLRAVTAVWVQLRTAGIPNVFRIIYKI